MSDAIDPEGLLALREQCQVEVYSNSVGDKKIKIIHVPTEVTVSGASDLSERILMLNLLRRLREKLNRLAHP